MARRRSFLPRAGHSPERRRLLASMLALGSGLFTTTTRAEPDASSATDADSNEDLRNLKLSDLSEGGRRFVFIAPRWQNPDALIPLVVFLHGLGETSNEKLGAYAWLERYGLGSAWQRLTRAPIARTTKRGEWTETRLAQVNTELAKRPFRGFAMACPYMPKPRGAASLDEYAKWIEHSLVPRCRREARVFTDARRTYLCGVSLGGYVSLEMVLRLPHLFGAWAGVQTAIGNHSVNAYADRLARAGFLRPTLLLTSTLDPWRTSSEMLASALSAKKIPHTLRVVPGPHDQVWLREAGSIEALHWLDRVEHDHATL